MSMMLGHQIGRFNVRRLMTVVGLLPKLPSVYRYQVARTELNGLRSPICGLVSLMSSSLIKSPI